MAIGFEAKKSRPCKRFENGRAQWIVQSPKTLNLPLRQLQPWNLEELALHNLQPVADSKLRIGRHSICVEHDWPLWCKKAAPGLKPPQVNLQYMCR
jgi:hypothetical protein